MPVTLYVEQWQRLLGFADEIRAFMKEHDSELKRKERQTGRTSRTGWSLGSARGAACRTVAVISPHH